MPNDLQVAQDSDFMTPSLELTSGDRLPVIGLGTWKIGKDRAAQVVIEAAGLGYRHFDCACDYGNEREVGAGLRTAMQQGLRRDELWITSKLWNTYHAAEHVRPACERSLRDLGLDYLDLYLIHFPIAQRFVPFATRYPPEWVFDPAAAHPRIEPAAVPISETWRAMEALVQAGLVRNIGVCNFGVSLLRDLLSYSQIRPAVLQVELHPYLTQEKLLRFCREHRIAVTGFSPLGAESYHAIGMAQPGESVLKEEPVIEAAEQHGKSRAQVVLRWAVQRGTAVVPKAARPDHLAENLALFDFALTTEEMQAIGRLNSNRRFNDPGEFCEQAFGTFFPIYE
jgi:D-xylose reductase